MGLIAVVLSQTRRILSYVLPSQIATDVQTGLTNQGLTTTVVNGTLARADTAIRTQAQVNSTGAGGLFSTNVGNIVINGVFASINSGGGGNLMFTFDSAHTITVPNTGNGTSGYVSADGVLTSTPCYLGWRAYTLLQVNTGAGTNWTIRMIYSFTE